MKPTEKEIADIDYAINAIYKQSEKMPFKPFKEQTMKTPWQAFPEYKRQSLGWRMGDADGYLHTWRVWFQSLSKEDQASFIQTIQHPTNGWIFTTLRSKQPL
jgi:hypothetical protein